MKAIAICIIFLSSFCYCSAQKNLVADVFTLGHFKRYRIAQNTVMTYKLKGSSRRERHTLVDMNDSTLYIETGEAIQLNQVKKIIIDRSNFLTRKLSSFFRVAGVGYIALDAINSGINSDKEIFRERVLLVGGSLFLVGEIIHIANKKRISIGKNRTLKIIDLSLN